MQAPALKLQLSVLALLRHRCLVVELRLVSFRRRLFLSLRGLVC
jgi:hypothetical protein